MANYKEKIRPIIYQLQIFYLKNKKGISNIKICSDIQTIEYILIIVYTCPFFAAALPL